MSGSNANSRRTDFDSLRIGVCVLIVLAHALLIFAAEPRYHVKAATVSPTASAFYEIFRIAATPTFFTLAGWSAVASLRRRGAGQFLRERVMRIVVPLAAGILLLGPGIKFLELRGGRNLSLKGFAYVPPLQLDFLHFLPRYWGRLNLLTWSHLWFLGYLFLLSILLLPLLQYLARQQLDPRPPAARLVWLPAAGFSLLIAGLHGYWPYLPNLLTDWWNFILGGVCMALGGVMAARPGLDARFRQQAWPLLCAGLVCYGGVLWLGQSLPGRIVVGACIWFMIAGLIGIAGRYQPRPSPALSYLSEASMPIYVIHHLPVLVIGQALLGMDWPVGAKVGVIFLASLAISFGVYHFLIRPFALPRLLTGLAPVPARRAAPVTA